MPGPFTYIGTYRIEEGKREEAKKVCRSSWTLVETNEPRLVAFNVYPDERGRKVSVVQVHPDTASMEFQMRVVSDHLSSAFEYLEGTESEQVYGTPSPTLEEKLREFAEPGVPVTFMPIHEAGFTRASVR